MRHLLVSLTTLAVLCGSGSAVTAQEPSPDPEGSLTPEQEAAAEEPLPTATCLGKLATIVAVTGGETLGTAGADVIVGTDGDDVIRGYGGNDRICAGEGNDLVEGGDGKDRIAGGAGDDMLDGGLGNDTIDGGTGADMVTGAAGTDRLSGGNGDDTLDGGMGNDVCKGGPGQDWLPGCNDKRRTKGPLVVKKNTTLKGPHRGNIVIQANKVTLDCGGYSLVGPGGGNAIVANQVTGITIRNCETTNFERGIEFWRVRRSTVTRNRVHHNSDHGIAIYESHKNKLTSNIVHDNGFASRWAGVGFMVQDSRGNVLRDNSATGNDSANYLLQGDRGSTGNRLSANTSTGSRTGFDIAANDNTLADNHATGALEVGYSVNGGKNTFEGNVAEANLGLGFGDWAVPGANSYADNTCIGNREGGSQPEGLCDDSIPGEPEPVAEPSDNADAEGEPTAGE